MRAIGLAVAFLAIVPTPAAGRTRCAPKGARVVAANARIQVFTDDQFLMACTRTRGKTVVLQKVSNDPYGEQASWAKPRAAGRYASWLETKNDPSCKAGCPVSGGASTTMKVVDIARRKLVNSVALMPREYGLTDRGALAWTDADGLHSKAIAKSAVLLDQQIDDGSLRIYYSLVLWRRSGKHLWADPSEVAGG